MRIGFYFRRAMCAGIGCLMLTPAALGKNLVGDAVVLRTLDKVTATTKDYSVKVGESLTYGSLRVDVKHCEKKPPEEIPETYAFLQIFETKTEAEIKEDQERDEPVFVDGTEKVFSGWMLASKPAISALDHGVYDVWVIDCKSRLALRP
jgi:hypothetical protein